MGGEIFLRMRTWHGKTKKNVTNGGKDGQGRKKK